MSTKPNNQSDSEKKVFEELPNCVSGWEAEKTNEEYLFEYWKQGSNHIAARYEQITARKTRDRGIQLVIKNYDQFNHLINSTLITEQPPDRDRYIWKMAKNRMEEFPATEPLDQPPTFPEQINEWELIDNQSLQTNTWEHPLQGTLSIKETEIKASYANTRRMQTIEYQDPKTSKHTIVADISRTFAYEIAINTLKNLSGPLHAKQNKREELQSIYGLGPAKSKQLLLLGVTSHADLINHITSNQNPVNHHHSEAVDKVMSKNTIQELIG